MKNLLIIAFLSISFGIKAQPVTTIYNNGQRQTVIWNLKKDSVLINRYPYKFTQTSSKNLKEVRGFITAWNPKLNIYEKLELVFSYAELDSVDLYRNGRKETFSNLDKNFIK